jgi:hypothetical protein
MRWRDWHEPREDRIYYNEMLCTWEMLLNWKESWSSWSDRAVRGSRPLHFSHDASQNLLYSRGASELDAYDLFGS